MNKQQKAVVKESLKINPIVAVLQWLQFNKEESNRRKFARRNARLNNAIIK